MKRVNKFKSGISPSLLSLGMLVSTMLLDAGKVRAVEANSATVLQQMSAAETTFTHWGLLINGLLIVVLLVITFWFWLISSRRAREAEKISQSLSLNQKRLQYALEGSGLALWDYDIVNNEIYLDTQWAIILRKKAKDCVVSASKYSELIHPEDIERVRVTMRAVLADEVPSYRTSYRVHAADDSWKWVRAYGKVVERDKQGKPLRLTGTIADITLQKHMQEDLHISESRWQFALEGSGDGVWDWNVVSNEVFFSQRWKQILGYGADEIENRLDEWESRVHPEDTERCHRELHRHYNHEAAVYECEFRMRCKDNTYKWILARGKVIEWDNDGKPVRIIGTHTDVSERHLMRETLNLQSRAMEASVNGILIVDATEQEMPIVYCNHAFTNLTGYRRDEILGRNSRFLQAHDSAQPELELLRKAQHAGEATSVLLRNYHKDGSLFWNELSIAPVRDENGKLTHYVGISNDVTARVNTKDALRHESEFSNAAINALPGTFFVLDKDAKFLRLNDNVSLITGYSETELAGMAPEELCVEEDRDLVRAKIAECYRDGQAQCEARLLTKTGEALPFYFQAKLYDLGGEKCLVGTGTDISVLKQMQQELAQSQSLLSTIVEHMPAMVFLKRADDLSYVLLNKTGEEILEHKRDEVLGKTDQDLFTPEQAKEMLAIDREVVTCKPSVILPDAPFCSPSGWIRYLHTIKTCICDEQGRTTHLLGIAIDISDRIHAEEKLKYSERKLKEAQSIAKLGNWSLEYDTQEVYWSDELFHILGMVPEVNEATYEKFFAVVHPDDIELVKQSEVRAFAKGTPHSLDVRIVLANEETRWIHIEAAVSKDENGKPVRLAGTVQDITGRKLAEQAIRNSEARLRTILDTAVDSIIIIDSNGIIESVNPATEKIFGYSAREMLGNNVSILMPEPDSSAHDNYLRHYQATHDARIIGIGREVLGRRKDGSIFPMDLAVSENQFEAKLMFTGFVRDISLRKQAETDLLAAKEQAEQANRAKSEFLSNMSHELRTPMNAILGFAQLLQVAEPPLTSPQQQDVKEILIAGQHLLDLINGLLDLARIEAGYMKISIESVSVEQVVTECIHMVEPIRQKQEVTIQQEYDESGEVLVSADRMRLRQVLLNLLSNAVKYNKVGGSVIIRCRKKTNDQIRIEVEDTGIGIAPDRFGELFSSFSRLGAEASAIEGTGIGLAITKQLVELMHGEIGVRSQPGVGSSFWLDIPAAQAQTSLDVVWPEPRIIPAIQDTERAVLYIEDNTANLRFMEQLLRRRPELQLLTASDPLTGLALAQAHHPDLILLDIHLPEMNGYQVLRHLQGDPSTQDIPVIAVSANAMPGDVEHARQAGFAEYCTKPIIIDDFLRVMDLILNPDKPVP